MFNGWKPYPHQQLRFKLTDKQLHTVTDEQLKELEKQAKDVEKENMDIYNGLDAKKTQMMKLSEEVWGIHSCEAKYIAKAKLPAFPHNNFSDFKERVLNARKAVAEDEKKKADNAAAKQLVQDAVAWLVERGKVIGKDFTLDDAVKTANYLAFEEEKARLMHALSEGTYNGSYFIDFDGHYRCDDHCSGWDGESKRCDCGNQRVNWVEGFGHSFKEPCVNAETY